MKGKDFEIIGQEHIGVVVSDIEKSKEFYCDILGMDLIYEDIAKVPAGDIHTAFVRLNDLVLDLEQFPEWDDSLKDGLVAHISFKVKNLPAVEEYLRSKGVKFDWDKPSELKPFFNSENGIRFTFFRGPDNEMLELTESL